MSNASPAASSRVLPSSAIAAPRLDVEQQRVSAGDEQRGERRHRVAMLERRGEEVSLHVMHADRPERRRANANALA